jgi:hypothetical protein
VQHVEGFVSEYNCVTNSACKLIALICDIVNYAVHCL